MSLVKFFCVITNTDLTINIKVMLSMIIRRKSSQTKRVKVSKDTIVNIQKCLFIMRNKMRLKNKVSFIYVFSCVIS